MAQQRAAQIARHIAPQGLLAGQVAIITGSGQARISIAVWLHQSDSHHKQPVLIPGLPYSESPIGRGRNLPGRRQCHCCTG